MGEWPIGEWGEWPIGEWGEWPIGDRGEWPNGEWGEWPIGECGEECGEACVLYPAPPLPLLLSLTISPLLLLALDP